MLSLAIPASGRLAADKALTITGTMGGAMGGATTIKTTRYPRRRSRRYGVERPASEPYQSNINLATATREKHL